MLKCRKELATSLHSAANRLRAMEPSAITFPFPSHLARLEGMELSEVAIAEVGRYS